MLTNPDAHDDEFPDYGRAEVAEAAVRRLLDYVGAYGDGVVHTMVLRSWKASPPCGGKQCTDDRCGHPTHEEVQRHPLYTRDIEGIALLVRDALLRIPADGMSTEHGTEYTDVHGDARTVQTSSRDTAIAMRDDIRRVQARQQRSPDAEVVFRAVGPWMTDPTAPPPPL
ncbi:hypothetical protein NWFMUON74_61140 [Nocardia wallacei]|uniref:Uncharacterized protein n=2 Tax=Nocardia wallacei TaxID=480035 RepID=A0A7G1KTA9_9NOCA|nr:hypothetical protein NWFMUON74_61140 [Nocardia wallacei]